MRWRWICVGLVMAIAATEPAYAGNVDEAKAHYARATSAYALGRFAEAAAEYEKAFDLKPDPALLYNAAQAHRVAGNKARALLLYRSYLRIFSDGPNHDEVQHFISELQKQIDQEAKQPPKAEPAPPREPPPAPSIAAPQPTAPSTADPSAVTSPASPSPELVTQPAAAEKPLAKRPWFWATLAGAAIVVAGGVTLGVVLGSPDKNPTANLGKIEAN
jgi:tetratricopeptide (TPR) repeat protein